jgi:hypothetical protein
MLSDNEFKKLLQINNPEDMLRVRINLDKQTMEHDPILEKMMPQSETIWVKRIGANHAKVYNIPFFADKISLHDIIRIEYIEGTLPVFVNVIDRHTYKIVIEYQSENENVSENFKTLKSYFGSFGIEIEGFVAGHAFLAVPCFKLLSDCTKIIDHAPDLIVRYMVNGLGEVEQTWKTPQRRTIRQSN